MLVELAGLERNAVGVRDSKAPEAGHLALESTTFAVLLGRIKHGALDL